MAVVEGDTRSLRIGPSSRGDAGKDGDAPHLSSRPLASLGAGGTFNMKLETDAYSDDESGAFQAGDVIVVSTEAEMFVGSILVVLFGSPGVARLAKLAESKSGLYISILPSQERLSLADCRIAGRVVERRRFYR